MHTYARKLSLFVTWLSLFSLLTPLITPVVDLGIYSVQAAVSNPVTFPDTGPFRVTVTYPNTLGRERLDKLDVVVLEETDTGEYPTAIVLVDTAQLSDIARLGFKPHAAEDISLLVTTHAGMYPELVESMQPVLDQAASVHELSLLDDARFKLDAENLELTTEQEHLHTMLQALTTEQQSILVSLATVDDDGDGLSNTEESWWCTDIANPDSDNDGVSDGAEVQDARDWLRNQRNSPPASGKPFAGWPAQIDGCLDSDMDSVPDLAETWDLGLNPNRESTDRDKFDDGQELFGNTYCPGSGGFCGYGALPRNEDWGVIFAEMPSWVKAPGNHPFVAAFPVPEVDVVESSLHVETVTVITTDHTISQGEERSYSTSKTEGTSSSVADTVTWNEWQEVSESLQQSIMQKRVLVLTSTNNGFWKRAGKFTLGSLKIVGGVLAPVSVCTAAAVGTVSTVGALSVPGGVVCAGTVAGGVTSVADGFSDIGDAFAPDEAQADISVNQYQSTDMRLQNEIQIDNQVEVVVNQCCDADNLVKATDGNRYSYSQSGQLTYSRQYQIANPLPVPLKTTINTNGRSWGGSQTTTHSRYEEHTITNGEAFSSGESWGTAVATDTAHAADLWFTYQIRNTGMEYAREIGDLAFNVYIGDDPNPAVTYFVAPDLGGDGMFHNFMPGEAHEYTSQRIPLSLEQMRAIDLGGPVRVVLEDYTYGIDELFYEDAINASVLLAVDDDMADGDEAIDFYLIPTWGNESVLDVLTRYFPHEVDEDGNLISVSTPEFGGGYSTFANVAPGAATSGDESPAYITTPAEAGFGNAADSSPIYEARLSSTGIDAGVDAQSNTALAQATTVSWRKHSLSLLEWWNVYMDALGDGTASFQNTPAAPGGMAFFRFNKDSDLDGYSDRSEIKLGTDPEDAASHPNPEPAGGIHNVRVGDYVTSTLLLLNTGIYDAYGVEAVMIAPDDSITIENNTVGGSGRVRALQGVVVGSRVLPPDYTNAIWHGSAEPFSAGYYTGNMDRNYTFTALDAGSVGKGTLRFAWDDGQGGSGTLNFGSDYASPSPVEASHGVQIGLVSGQVQMGDTFVVSARTPRDTFQYTVNSEPYTPPLVIISYNDPQGNHRFVLPPETIDLNDPIADLLPYSGQMLQDIGVEIVTTEAFTTGTNTTDLVVNNPTEATLQDGHLFLEFINISGTVASEVPVTVTLEPGPNVVPVTWDTATFSPTFEADEDYIVMAFWTDYQGNILDTAGRPLSSFQEDPKAVAVLPTATWDFGTATQGQILHHTLDIANTGFMDLLTYVSAPAEMGIPDNHRTLRPGDVESYDLTLDTAGLPVGPYNTTLTLRTGDPANPGGTVLVTGEIVAGTPVVQPVTDYPLYLDVAIPGEHSQGEWVSFVQNIGANPEDLHPLYVYSQSEDLLGVGKYATAFSTGIAAYDIFGDGRDGDLTVNSNQTTVINQTRVSVSASDIFASPDNSNGFKVGDLVLFHQTQSTENTGLWELNHIIAINSPTSWTLAKSLNYVYDNTNGQSQVIKVPQYRNVTVNNGGTLTMPSWDGLTGGILIFLANGDVVVKGTISANGGAGLVTYTEVSPGGTGGGFRGGSGNRSPEGESHVRPYTGESEISPSFEGDSNQGGAGQPINGNAGTAAAFNNGNLARSGGGGSYGTSGNPGTASRAGIIVGEASLTHLFFGGGGGGGGRGHNVGNGVGSGGAGGAAVAILSRNLMVNGGVITARGGNAGIDTNTSGQWHEGGGASGGAGAGGSILLKVGNATLEENQVIAVGGKGTTATGGLNGNGGDGRIRIEYCESLSGSTNPAASTEKLDCYIIEQIESSPYNTARLNLPESFSGGRTYRVQYGRRLVFNGAVNELTTLRVPAREAAKITLDALVSDMPVDSLTLKLDIGNNGVWDWQGTQDYSGSTTLSALDLTDAFNAYWAAQGKPLSGDMDVPVRVSLNAPGQVLLTNLYTPPVLDLSVSTSDVAFTVSPTVESEVVPVDVTLHNDGGVDPGGFMVAFYAESQTIKGNSQSYVGSAFVPGIPAGSTAQASFDWNTLGFTGTTALHVVVDPYGHLNEANKNNNEAVAALPILTRPDIVVDEIMLSDDEPVVGEEVVVTLKLHNTGQAPAGTQIVVLHQGSPESGLLLDTRTQKSLKGGETASLSFTWIPAETGQYRLFATGDRDNTINEFDEGNNRTWRDVYVGLNGPLALDGGSGSESAYTPELGFGVLDEGLPDVMGVCPSAPLAAGVAGKTHRRDPNGQLVYRFDHLLPEHYYHLDVTLYECDHAGRQERIYIDDNLVAGPEDLGDGQAHRLSLLVDPVFYSDRSIRVTVEAPGTDGAIISHISLHDIGYRYVDAGGAESPARITEGDLGGEWLDGVDNTDWGTFSRQSVRVDQNDAELRYRFNNLNSHKRYRLHFTFYQPSGQIHVQRVKVDGIDVGLTVNTGDYTVHRETVRGPLLAYVEDGSLVVSIIRLNALSGAMVNEIILEEETLPTEALCQPDITPNFTDVLGDVLLNGEDAPPGTIIQAINPRGDTVGCYLMDESGRYGMMRIYGEDTSVSPPVTGMRNGEMVAFYVDGAPAVSAPLHNWQDDKLTHRVDLNAGGIEGQSILMRAGWNLISFRYEPPVPLVARTLDSIQGRFSHVLGENGIYVPSLSPVYQSLTQLHTGEAYYTYITGTTSVNLLVEGTIISPNTEISLHSGWNWIGYLHDTEMPVTTALQSIDGQYQRVLGLDKTFDPTYPDYSTLKNLHPGDGYLIYMTQKAILTYPSDGRQSNQFDVRQIIGSCDYVSPTPYMTLVFGQVTVNGEPAPVGTHVDVLTPQGDVAGCFVVDTPGKLSLTHVYGADDSVSPTIPGFKPDETLTFQVNGLPVTETTIGNDIWADDKAPRYVELHATSHPLYLPLVMRQ